MDKDVVLEIFSFLDENIKLELKDKYWWPNSGSFEVVIGAILTQNTTWSNVEKSLNNLEGYLDLDRFITLSQESLKEMIKPSGFYNQKAPRVLQLAKNIKNEFGDFKTFQKEVSRKWLLNQKGIGLESADAILCYGCYREILVIDTYTKRLLKKFGLEFKKYDEYRVFLEETIKENWDILKEAYRNDLHLCYALFHGKIVDFNKIFRYNNKNF
jgi:endonuclease-3 related protein